MFAETAIIDYPLSFANQGNQAICRILSPFAANKRKARRFFSIRLLFAHLANRSLLYNLFVRLLIKKQT
jgi:hypothetical protein